MDFKELDKKGMGIYLDMEKKGLSSFALKMIAVVTMLLDHTAIILFCDNDIIYNILRSIGRISFPIFCFILVEGFFYTKNKGKHLFMLGIFALISEVPYDMMHGSFFDMSGQNVMFTLFLGFALIWILYNIALFKIPYPKFLTNIFSIGTLNWLLGVIVVVTALVTAHLFHTDYEYAGVLLVMCFYAFRNSHVGKAVANLVFNIGMFEPGIQCFGSFSVIPIAIYNGKEGKRKWKYFFYLFYPVHLLLLVFLKEMIFH